VIRSDFDKDHPAIVGGKRLRRGIDGFLNGSIVS